MQKRGLSAVVTTLVIILLVLVATGIIWGVIRGVIGEGIKDVSLSSFSKEVDIKSAVVEGDSLLVTVKKGSGNENLTSIKFIFENGTDSQILERDTTLGNLEEKIFSFYLAELTIQNINKISVAPVYGEETAENVVDDVELKEPITGTGGAGSKFVSLGYSGMGEVSYSISGDEDLPEFKEVIIDPLDVMVGDTQTFTARVSSPHGGLNVTTETQLDHDLMVLPLEYVSTDENDVETWSASWEVYDTHYTSYNTTFIATDSVGNVNTVNLTWTDPTNCQIYANHGGTMTIEGNCTFVDAVSGNDGGDIHISSGKTMTINPGATMYWNDGYSILFSGAQIQLSSGSTEKGLLYYTDVDQDGYAPNATLKTSSTDAVRAKDALDTNDCYDIDANVYPGNPNWYTTNVQVDRESWDYNCSGAAEKQYTDTNGECAFCDSVDPPCMVGGAGSVGWTSGTSPACGSSDTYVSDPGTCQDTGTQCEVPDCDSSTTTQGCH